MSKNLTDAKRKAIKRYQSKLVSVSFRIAPEERDRIKKYTDETGEPLRHMILRLIDKEISEHEQNKNN